MPVSDINPWDKQDKESAQAFQAFTIYRDTPTGERSIRRVAQGLSKSATLVARWSSRWGWVERCLAWDRELDRVKQRQHAQAVSDMAARHANQAKNIASALTLPMRALQERLTGPDGAAALAQLRGLPLADLVELINGCARNFAPLAKLERLSLGEPETITQDRGGPKDGGAALQADLDKYAQVVASMAEEEKPDDAHTAATDGPTGGDGAPQPVHSPQANTAAGPVPTH